MSKAAEQDKDLLMNFTGSDWCGWCMRLKDEVFTQPTFKKQAPQDFVLVELDFPQNKQQSEQIKAQNEKWAQKMQVQGFPTIVLADAEGRPYAFTGYREGGAESYVEHLDELQQVREKRDEALARAEDAEGDARAEALDEGLPNSAGIVRVPGAAHAPNLTHPEVVNPPLRSFLEEHA